MDNSFLHSKKLLLVDDEQELLKMVSDILKDAGFETVLTAMTVKEAILTAKEDTPDLIVLDVMLPDGDGFSLMKQLRTFTNVPIIFLTWTFRPDQGEALWYSPEVQTPSEFSRF